MASLIDAITGFITSIFGAVFSLLQGAFAIIEGLIAAPFQVLSALLNTIITLLSGNLIVFVLIAGVVGYAVYNRTQAPGKGKKIA